MTVQEAAKSLEIPIQTLYTKINRQKGIGLEFTKNGTKWNIDGRVLNKYKKAYPQI